MLEYRYFSVMGNRGNYILKSEKGIDIYYTHWRASSIAKDLALGEKEFIKFIKMFDKRDTLCPVPWTEGCVLIDTVNKEVLFWEITSLFRTSVRTKFLQLLASRWKGWNIKYAENEMYDIDKALGINYITEQEININTPDTATLYEIYDDIFKYPVVLIENGIRKVNFIPGSIDSILLCGETIIDILKHKKSEPLFKEAEAVEAQGVVIDVDNKKLVTGEVIIGLREQLEHIWAGWQIETGNFGYAGILAKGGIATHDIEMSSAEVDAEIHTFLTNNDSFDPSVFAERILSTEKNVRFHPNFFENIKPGATKLPWWQRLLKIVKSFIVNLFTS